MRLFQNSGISAAYKTRLARLVRGARNFEAMRGAFLADRYGACHFLAPVLNGDRQAFFTNGDDEALQKQWASEQGMPAAATLQDILLAQIEHHRTEVFYNIDPLRYGSAFVKKLPGHVRVSMAWRAAPSPGADFSAYDRVVCNFPSILQSYEDRGWKAAYFAPAHDPVMDGYAANADRPVDVLFVGGYSRHHSRRAQFLEAVAGLSDRLKIQFHLDRSRITKLAESPLGPWLPLKNHRRPQAIRAVSQDPIFGLDLYQALSRAKIVVNGAVDMAGADRGNMRCFETMGCGALLLSDEGNYPAPMRQGITMLTYGDAKAAISQIEALMAQPARRQEVAAAGHAMVRREYSKEIQWKQFQALCD